MGSGEKRSLPGGIDLTSIVIISSALGFIFILTGEGIADDVTSHNDVTMTLDTSLLKASVNIDTSLLKASVNIDTSLLKASVNLCTLDTSL